MAMRSKVHRKSKKTGTYYWLALVLAVVLSLSACVSISFEELSGEPVYTEDYVGDYIEEDTEENTGKDTEKDTKDYEKDYEENSGSESGSGENSTKEFRLEEIPEYSGTPYVEVNGNIPYFLDSELTTESFETYSDLDELGRCGVAFSSIGVDLMPTEKRGSISRVKPSGWQNVRYDNVDGRYLYNRCHLIGFQLTAENANEKNLITGTRYLNVEGMLPFENQVAEYVKETGNHVLYRITPIFEGDNLLASGVLMEAKSVEDKGEGVLFCVYTYNVQPGIGIDYATGESWMGEKETIQGETYVLNVGTKKFHYPSCSSAEQLKEENKETFTGNREELLKQGYEPCGKCKP